MIYFSYGSNLSIAVMRRRCPTAVPLGKLALRKARLVFRGVADCVFDEDAKCWGGLWRVSRADEKYLDQCEGINSGAYSKEWVGLTGYPGEDRMFFYVMNSTGIFPPSTGYFDRIREGYRDFQIPIRHLNDALKASWKDKNPSHRERNRYMRDGRPRLAKLLKTGTPTTGNLFGN